MHFNDAKFAALGAKGFTSPTVNSRWREFLIAGTTGANEDAHVNDLEHAYLNEQAIPVGTLNDRWYAFLGGQGHTQGHLTDRWYAWFLAAIP